ncbi:MAG: hypothetical protein PHD05_00685 [Sphaerochaetaceae bacterium]|nr:hypothetical protein [Sphaerochaetaceae bacterium]
MKTQTISLTDHLSGQKSIVKNIFSEFEKPILNNVFLTNIAVLRIESNFYEFTNDRWVQRPSVFCLDVYNEPLLYPVIMLVNNIKTFLEFIPDHFPIASNGQRTIIAPYKETISRVLQTSKKMS